MIRLRTNLSLILISLIGLLNIDRTSAQAINVSAIQTLHKTSGLINHLRQLSPAYPFVKGQKAVNGLTYHYSNWKGKGGIQIFSRGEDVKMLSIVAITTPSGLAQLKTPIAIDLLISDLTGKKNADWFSENLSKPKTSDKELYSQDRKVALSYDEPDQKLTVTLRLL